MGEVDEIIGKIRSTIYALGMGQSSRGSVTTSLLWSKNCVSWWVELHVSIDGAVDTAVTKQVAEHLMATLREAVTNIERHANATEASIVLRANDGHCHLEVTDNGDGFDGKGREGGLGLTNLRRRGEKLNSRFELASPPSGGTILTWRVPLSEQ